MKKLIFAIHAVMCGISAMSAQGDIFNNPNNKDYWGIRSGIELATANTSAEKYNTKPGVSVGVINHVPLVANFYIEPSLKFYYNAYCIDDPSSRFVYDNFPPTENKTVITDVTYRKFGFRIPVMAGYRFDFTSDLRVNVFTGPVFEVGLLAKEYTKWSDGSKDSSNNQYTEPNSMNRIDLKWGFGAGIAYKSYYLEASGAAGLLNLTDGDRYKENIVTISVGYNF